MAASHPSQNAQRSSTPIGGADLGRKAGKRRSCVARAHVCGWGIHVEVRLEAGENGGGTAAVPVWATLQLLSALSFAVWSSGVRTWVCLVGNG